MELVAAALQEVADELMSANGEDRLGVELDAFDVELPHAHGVADTDDEPEWFDDSKPDTDD